MQQSEELDVLIVGAGPTGLTPASELLTFGVRFRDCFGTDHTWLPFLLVLRVLKPQTVWILGPSPARSSATFPHTLCVRVCLFLYFLILYFFIPTSLRYTFWRYCTSARYTTLALRYT
jgi:hypothetical protein